MAAQRRWEAQANTPRKVSKMKHQRQLGIPKKARRFSFYVSHVYVNKGLGTTAGVFIEVKFLHTDYSRHSIESILLFLSPWWTSTSGVGELNGSLQCSAMNFSFVDDSTASVLQKRYTLLPGHF